MVGLWFAYGWLMVGLCPPYAPLMVPFSPPLGCANVARPRDDFPWIVYAFHWFSMVVHIFQWFSLMFNDFQWLFMVSQWASMISLNLWLLAPTNVAPNVDPYSSGCRRQWRQPLNNWKPIEIIENQWKPMKIIKHYWKPMQIIKDICKYWTSFQKHWKSLNINENQWNSKKKSMKVNGI